ncbi:nuclear transport factor 2 family protein [Roseateles sp.]|uniref:nuclear transport factor 2 family protein n=1 Tax=Roseateles sp. TaxID=1971397 RepID=UPI0032663A4C
MLIDELEMLQAEAGCRRTVLRSAHCIDTPDPAGLAALFTLGGELHRPAGEPVQGRAAIEATYRSRPAERLTRHLVVSTLVEMQAPDEACALSRVLLWVGDAGAIHRLKHRMKLESVSGLLQQALLIDVAAKVLADNLASLLCAAAASQAD